jgi:hypothetical protein
MFSNNTVCSNLKIVVFEYLDFFNGAGLQFLASCCPLIEELHLSTWGVNPRFGHGVTAEELLPVLSAEELLPVLSLLPIKIFKYGDAVSAANAVELAKVLPHLESISLITFAHDTLEASTFMSHCASTRLKSSGCGVHIKIHRGVMSAPCYVPARCWWRRPGDFNKVKTRGPRDWRKRRMGIGTFDTEDELEDSDYNDNSDSASGCGSGSDDNGEKYSGSDSNSDSCYDDAASGDEIIANGGFDDGTEYDGRYDDYRSDSYLVRCVADKSKLKRHIGPLFWGPDINDDFYDYFCMN